MKIICKVKDYYDYVGFGNSEDIVFDRRNNWGTTPDTEEISLFSNYKIIDEYLCHHNSVDSKVIGLFLGYNLYVFLITAETKRTYFNKNGVEILKKYKYDVELINHTVAYNVKHTLPVEFVEIDMNIKGRYYFSAEDLVEEIKKGQTNLWVFKPLFSSSLTSSLYKDLANKIPILKNTFVPKFVPADIAYRNIEEWLIAQHNDVDQESIGLTDVDKAINHGFDKKYSFRSTK